MSEILSRFAPDPAPFYRDFDVPAHPLRFTLQTGAAVTREEIASIVARRHGIAHEIRPAHRSAGRVTWAIALHPLSIGDAAETMIALFDLGQLSFSIPPGRRAANQPFMPNQLESNIDVLGCVEPLRQLDTLGRKMSQLEWLDRSDEERTANQQEFARLQEQLPPSVIQLLRGRISSARRLTAPMRRAKCSSCYMSVPRGDYGSILAGRRPVLCQHCGVLLFADDEERATVSSKAR